MNNFLLVPDNGPSWEGFILTTSTSLEDVKKMISEFKKYCKDTVTWLVSVGRKKIDNIDEKKADEKKEGK